MGSNHPYAQAARKTMREIMDDYLTGETMTETEKSLRDFCRAEGINPRFTTDGKAIISTKTMAAYAKSRGQHALAKGIQTSVRKVQEERSQEGEYLTASQWVPIVVKGIDWNHHNHKFLRLLVDAVMNSKTEKLLS